MKQTKQQIPTLLDNEVNIVLYVHTDIFGAELGQCRLHSRKMLGNVRIAVPSSQTYSPLCCAWTCA